MGRRSGKEAVFTFSRKVSTFPTGVSDGRIIAGRGRNAGGTRSPILDRTPFAPDSCFFPFVSNNRRVYNSVHWPRGGSGAAVGVEGHPRREKMEVLT